MERSLAFSELLVLVTAPQTLAQAETGKEQGLFYPFVDSKLEHLKIKGAVHKPKYKKHPLPLQTSEGIQNLCMGLADCRQDLQEVPNLLGAEREAGQYTKGTKHGFVFRNLNFSLNDFSGTIYCRTGVLK